MPDTMIKRMATKLRDIAIRNGSQVRPAADYMEDARELLTVMREPTGEMFEAGAKVRSGHDERYLIGPDGIFTAMIDAALAEGE